MGGAPGKFLCSTNSNPTIDQQSACALINAALLEAMDAPKIVRGGGKQSKRAQKRSRAETSKADSSHGKPAQHGRSSAGQNPRGSKRPREDDERNEIEKTPGKAAPSEQASKKPKQTKPKSSTTPSTKKPAISSLQSKFKAKLEGGQFRWLNEQLYTTTSDKAMKLFKQKPELYNVYHRGFESQVQRWPENPAEMIAAEVKKMPKGTVVGDFGCGNALIARTVPHKVYSFDLCKTNKHVTVASSADVPLEDSCLDVAVFSLSLMGTDYQRFLLEARRTLKVGGQLIVAEVKSRYSSGSAKGDAEEEMDRGIASFKRVLKKLGFRLEDEELENRMFVMFHFRKLSLPEEQETKLGKLIRAQGFIDKDEGVLKSCMYKKR